MKDLHRLHKAIRDYFDYTPVEEWSYLNFLETFKPVIMSKLDVPKQEDKGTWRKRFITRLDKIAEDDAYNEQQRKLAIRLKEKLLSVSLLAKDGFVPSEVMMVSFPQPLVCRYFWNHIEKEKEDLRGKREIVNKTNSVRNNTEIEALDLLDTARTEKAKEILSSLFLYISSSSDYTKEGEEEYEKDENYSDDTEEDNENRITQEKKEQFRKIFQGIPTEAKLVLNSKTVVEDVLFEYAKDLDYESHAHSFIICDHDDKIKALFSKEDRKELTKKPSLPSVDYEIGKELAKYMKEDLVELRQEVMCNFLKDKEFYDPKKHYLKEWIQVTLRHLCNLYENPSAPLCREQYEDWFTVNLFGNCFDFLMRHPRMSTDIKRTDAPSTASENRKNRARKPKQRKLTGRKIDGIIHHPTYNIELGALEAARSFVNDGDRKLLIESFKMPKTLKDILVDMIRSKRCNDKEVNKLVAIGILHFRYNIQFIIIENNLKALGFFEQKTPKEDVFKEEDLISEILDNGQDLSQPTTPENINSIIMQFACILIKQTIPNTTLMAFSYHQSLELLYAVERPLMQRYSNDNR
ncbi:5130_t:CDS:2 [Funneliformis mosseae]|uniref:5130_t:CDS:1 n=1 Tax=Funneliformis mosseae TaxID=27381 RepID=A0A9N8ZL03_FUNMO|nr:5130_t:CDS:2 [Funneliformis mosseae]